MKRKRIAYGAALTVLLLAVLAWRFTPLSPEHATKAMCRVQARAWYVVPVSKGDTLYLTLRDDSLQNAATRSTEVAAATDISGFFISYEGHTVTTDSIVGACPDHLSHPCLAARLQQLDTLLQTRLDAGRAEQKELDDYARSHSAVDDGYNEVMAYRAALDDSLKAEERTLASVRKALALKNAEARIATSIALSVPARGVHLHARIAARQGGLVLLVPDTLRLPAGSERLPVFPSWLSPSPKQLVAFNDIGGATATPEAVRQSLDAPALGAAEGGAYTGRWGYTAGIRARGRCLGTASLLSLIKAEMSLPEWWIANVKGWFSSLFSGTESRPAKRMSTACVRLTLGADSLYEGQATSPGRGAKAKPHGTGRLHTPDGAIYEGKWANGTLVSGTRTDRHGTYTGTFGPQLQPHGQGIIRTASGERYEGEWKDGRRSGHGFSSMPGRMVRCGEWRNGRFLGERMIYTANRIYGIDISRHQHEIGRKRYGIDWSQLRITSLGAGRRVQGQVSYPVSFVYIKSTQGKRIYNRYYPNDLRQARRHGIPVGSYHFFSTQTSGKEQAAWFLRMTWVAKGDLPPVLDLEPTESEIRKMGGEEKLFAEVRTWLRMVEQRLGRRPVLYVSQQFISQHLSHRRDLLERYDVWIARYGEYKPYVHLLHWQLTPQGRVRGIKGNVDINVFNGTKEQFRDYLRKL